MKKKENGCDLWKSNYLVSRILDYSYEPFRWLTEIWFNLLNSSVGGNEYVFETSFLKNHG